jgi:hypothetical protein
MSAAAFSIGWEPSGDVPGGSRRGRILGPDGLNDAFIAPLGVWDAAQYEAQWRDGIGRIVSGETPSSIVTRLYATTDGSYAGEWWPMWRERETAVFQNQLILSETIPEFDLLDLYASLEPTRPAEEFVSEWRVAIELLQRFLSNRT